MNSSPPDFDRFVAGYFEGRMPAVGLECSLRDLALDSLDLLDFMLAIERTFDVSIDIDAVNEAQTLREILEVATSPR